MRKALIVRVSFITNQHGFQLTGLDKVRALSTDNILELSSFVSSPMGEGAVDQKKNKSHWKYVLAL